MASPVWTPAPPNTTPTPHVLAQAKVKDKATGKYKKKMKSMPYALCKVQLSSDKAIPVGAEFTIAGYMLRHIIHKDEKMLAFESQYIAEFADQYGNEWVRKMITEEYWADEKKGSTDDSEE